MCLCRFHHPLCTQLFVFVEMVWSVGSGGSVVGHTSLVSLLCLFFLLQFPSLASYHLPFRSGGLYDTNQRRETITNNNTSMADAFNTDAVMIVVFVDILYLL